MPPPRTTIAILSIGHMGRGIASLLISHDFRVITNTSSRSAATQARAASAGIEQLASDTDLVARADYILSIVPPRDARATALRVVEAVKSGARAQRGALWFLDLNAGSPAAVREIHAVFQSEAPDVKFVDGGIIGAPPARREDGSWTRPGVPLSGPHDLSAAPLEGARLAAVLNARYLGAQIGRASGLKACFAALSKGFTALALQSYTTAAKLSVLPDLRYYLDVYNPNARDKAEKSIVGCTGKAYRWVEEMHLIGQTFAQQGGFGESASVFREIAAVYQGLADLVEQKGAEGLESADGVVGKLGGYLAERDGE